jgi:site-specific DNA recombinase
MGGTIPLGYDVKDREVVVNAAEAVMVRNIFDTYLRLGSVLALRAELDQRGIVSKKHVSAAGRSSGGRKFSKGALHWLLRNPVYVGRVTHRGQTYEGRQAPIISLDVWEGVQELLTSKTACARQKVVSSGRPLMGLLFDDRGNAMSPSYTVRPKGKRYAYYVSQALLQGEKAKAGSVSRVPADATDRLVRQAVEPTFPGEQQDAAVRAAVERVVVFKDRIEIRKVDADVEEDDQDSRGQRTVIVRGQLSSRGSARILNYGNAGPDPVVVRAIARAHEWRGWLEADVVHSYRDIAAKAAVNPGYVQAVLPLAFLEPQLTRELLDGRRQIRGGLMELLRRGIPLDWHQQRASF